MNRERSYDDAFTDRLRLDYALEESPELLDALLERPARVLEDVGVGEEALVCPPEAHESLSRGEVLAAEANEIGDVSIGEALPRLKELAAKGLGPNPIATKVPFGIRFAERVGGLGSTELTGTASVECTFGLECKGDVDG